MFFCHGGIYAVFMYLGAIKELHKKRDKLDIAKLRIYGSSAGSSMGLICLLVLNNILDITIVTRLIKDFFNTKTNLDLLCVARLGIELLEALWRQIKPYEREAMKLANRHLYIAVSQPTKLVFLHEFADISELSHCILLSSNIAILSSYPAFYKQCHSIDGGYRIRLSDLPRKCLKIYNYGYKFPDCMYIPTNKKQRELIRSGKKFIKDKFKQTDVFYDALEDFCFYGYSEPTIAFIFLLQSISYKDYSLTNLVNSICTF